MPAIKIRRDEFEIVKAAADRVARRSNSKFVLDESLVQVTDEDTSSNEPKDAEEGDKESPLICG
jgi:hypothetical protein